MISILNTSQIYVNGFQKNYNIIYSNHPAFLRASRYVNRGRKRRNSTSACCGKTFPPNETIGFRSNEVEITFDEFIQLNNPIQTIFFVPNHATPIASIKNKTLSLKWEEQLKENTTYVIYMNGALKDVTESNDTLMTYVFQLELQLTP